MKLSQAKKDQGIYCCAYACRNKPEPKKGGLCHKHYSRRRREIDPVAVRYKQMKGNAKVRGKEFTISLEEFRNFCKLTGYIIRKGVRGYSATIDRRCNAHGYHIWNIQLMSHRANCSKGDGYSGDEFDDPSLPF